MKPSLFLSLTFLGAFVFTGFSQVDTIDVPVPQRDRVFAHGDTVEIQWKSSETIPTNDIELQLYIGTEYEQTLSYSSVEEYGAAEWTVSSDLRPSLDYRIKVMRKSDRQEFGYSGKFGIEKVREIFVTAPDADDVLAVGEAFTISWKSVGTVGDRVRIELLKNDGYHSTLTQSTPNDGEYAWIPNGAFDPTATYRIRVWGILAEPVVGLGAPFKFRNDLSLEFLGPRDGDTVYLGQTVNIGWQIKGYSTGVTLHLNYRGKRIDKIADSVSGGTYRWEPDPGLTEGGPYSITVVEKHNPDIRAESGQFVVVRPTIRILRPLGGATYTDTLNIAWDNHGIRSPLSIELYRGTDFVLLIRRGVRPIGVHKWVIDSTRIDPGKYRVRIGAIESKEISAFSEDFVLDFEAHHSEGVPVAIPVEPDPTTNTKPLFRWHAVKGAAHYRLLVSNSSDFSNPLVAIPLADTAFTPGVELPLGRIFWKVKSDLSESYSSMQSFAIAPATIPLLVRFDGKEVDTDRPVFRWHPVAGATEYRIEVYERSRSETVLAIDVPDTTFTPFVGLDPGLHHWRVKSNVDSHRYSAWDSLFVPREIAVIAHNRPEVVSGIRVPAKNHAAPVLLYGTTQGGLVEIRLHDARGNLLAEEHRFHAASGRYRLQIPNTVAASGMYFCTVHMDGRIFRQSVVRTK